MAAASTPLRPTRIRYVVLALTTMVAVLLYVDRICLSFLARYVQEDLSISQTEMGFVLSSFFITYALGQLPAGWFSDRFGARLMLGLYLAVWSLFTGLLGLAHSMLILVALRSVAAYSKPAAIRRRRESSATGCHSTAAVSPAALFRSADAWAVRWRRCCRRIFSCFSCR